MNTQEGGGEIQGREPRKGSFVVTRGIICLDYGGQWRCSPLVIHEIDIAFACHQRVAESCDLLFGKKVLPFSASSAHFRDG